MSSCAQEHGEIPCHQCNQDDQPCAPLAVVLMFQSLAQHLSEEDNDEPRDTADEELARLSEHMSSQLYTETRAFEMLLHAQRLFGAHVSPLLLSAVNSNNFAAAPSFLIAPFSAHSAPGVRAT